MKIKETVLAEIDRMGPSELMRLHELLSTMHTSKAVHESETSRFDLPYREVQQVLSCLVGSLTDDVIADREERI